MLGGSVENALGSIKIIMLVGLVKIFIGDVIGIMLGRRNYAWPSKFCWAAAKLSSSAVLKLCLTALKKL